MKKLIVLVLLAIASPAFAIVAKAPSESPVPAAGLPALTPEQQKAVCTSALQQDSQFAAWVLEKGYQVQSARCMDLDQVAGKRRLELDRAQHETAAAAVSKNERHVVMAYIAMWLVAVGFLVFLWRRQQLLRTEITQLRKELDDASKE